MRQEELIRLAVFGLFIVTLGAPAAAQGKRGGKRRFPTVQKVAREIEKLRRAKKPSIAGGTLSKGSLANAAKLPVRGIGYHIANPARATHFGTDEMVFGLMELGARMHDLYGSKGVFVVGDISAEKGGKLAPHINHQMGLDVDLGLYVCSKRGKPRGNLMRAFDKEGKSKDGVLRFDAARNWEFIVAMLESEHLGEIRFILLADWLKAQLLEHARGLLARSGNRLELKRLKRLIRSAEQLIRQPSSSPHDNHIHLSLKQTQEDRRGR